MPDNDVPEDAPAERWRVSAYENAIRQGAAVSNVAQGANQDRVTLLSSTLSAELRQVERTAEGSDILEIVAACMRHKENVLIHLNDGGFVLPITLFPQQRLFHTPLVADQWSTLKWARLKLIDVQPAALRPPGDVYTERVASAQRYGALTILLWLLALHGPRRELLPQVDARAAYRLSAGPELQALPLSGALSPAVQKLRAQPMTLRTLSKLPGMDVERASRLLNALYLQSALMVLRSGSALPPDTQPMGFIERLRSRWGGL